MKRNIVLIGFVIFLLANVTTASAQLVAGSPEDRLYQQITSATDSAQKEQLCLQFASEFGASEVVVDIYVMLMEIYGQRNENGKAIEYGEKAIEMDDDNITALMTVSRTLAVARRLLPKALRYAERAVAAAENLGDRPPPPGYTQDSWMAYVSSTVSAARNILNYARSVGGA